jgi:hypothetical protein
MLELGVEMIAIGVINVAILCSPLVIGISWWIWFRRDRKLLPASRARILLIGLGAVSANALMYYAWLIYSSIPRSSDVAWELKSTLGNNVAVPLVMLALAGAIAGRGAARVLLAFSAVLGFFLWIGMGVL